MNNQLIENAISGYYHALESGDLQAFLDGFSEEIESHSPVGGPAIKGLDGMRLAFKTVRGTLAEVQFELGPRFIGGMAAAVQWTARGVAGNGRPVTFAGINVFRIDLQGKIMRIDAYWDPNDLMRQINA